MPQSINQQPKEMRTRSLGVCTGWCPQKQQGRCERWASAWVRRCQRTCVCVCRCVCGCSVCMRASYSLLSKSPWLKDLRLNLPSFTLTEARNFLPVRFQHHLSTLVSSTCLNSPLRHSKIRWAKICKPAPDMIKICCLVGSCDGMRSLPMPPLSFWCNKKKKNNTTPSLQNRSKKQHFLRLVSFFLPPFSKVLLPLAMS